MWFPTLFIWLPLFLVILTGTRALDALYTWTMLNPDGASSALAVFYELTRF